MPPIDPTEARLLIVAEMLEKAVVEVRRVIDEINTKTTTNNGEENGRTHPER
jgi:hypothetical protein